MRSMHNSENCPNFVLRSFVSQGPDLQRILRHTYDSAALSPDLRRACELRAINKKSYKLN